MHVRAKARLEVVEVVVVVQPVRLGVVGASREDRLVVVGLIVAFAGGEADREGFGAHARVEPW